MKRMTINQVAALYNGIENTTTDLTQLMYTMKGCARMMAEMRCAAESVDAKHIIDALDEMQREIDTMSECMDNLKKAWEIAGARTSDLVRLQAPNTNVI